MRSSLLLVIAGALVACSVSPGTSNSVSVKPQFEVLGQTVDRTVSRAAASSGVVYYGGPVISNAKVYVVYWGPAANINPAITAADGGIADFFRGVTNSSYLDMFNEYDTTIAAQAGSKAGSPGTGQHIGRGNYAGTFELPNAPTGSITDDQIQATLLAATGDGGTLPPQDPNTLYALYFPPGTSISLGGSGSCFTFLAYHEATASTAQPTAYYMVMPDCGGDFNGMTEVTSHELAEAVSDGIPTPGNNPNYPQAWNATDGSEVGDLCQGSGGVIPTPAGSFAVQGVWDNNSGGCVTSSTRAQDFSVAFPVNQLALQSGTPATVAGTTATVAGAAQPLTLSVHTPAGVSATLSASIVNSGDSFNVTLTADGSAPLAGQQVILEADAAGDGGTHTAALLLTTGL